MTPPAQPHRPAPPRLVRYVQAQAILVASATSSEASRKVSNLWREASLCRRLHRWSGAADSRSALVRRSVIFDRRRIKADSFVSRSSSQPSRALFPSDEDGLRDERA